MFIRTGTVWSDVLANVEAAVADHRLKESAWHPTRTDKPVLQDTVPGAIITDPRLTDWPATRQERYDSWVAPAGAPADLDFTPESVDTL